MTRSPVVACRGVDERPARWTCRETGLILSNRPLLQRGRTLAGCCYFVLEETARTAAKERMSKGGEGPANLQDLSGKQWDEDVAEAVGVSKDTIRKGMDVKLQRGRTLAGFCYYKGGAKTRSVS